MNMHTLAHRPCKPRLISSNVTHGSTANIMSNANVFDEWQQTKQVDVASVLRTWIQKREVAPLPSLLSLAQRESKSNDSSALRDHDRPNP